MIVDNGQRRRLVVDGVFEGDAGISRGVMAFIPNRYGRRPELARGGLLDGEPVMLRDVAKSDDGQTFTCRFEMVA